MEEACTELAVFYKRWTARSARSLLVQHTILQDSLT